MQDILRELFDNYYEGKIGSHPMTAAEREVWDRAYAALGEDFVDKMVSAQARSMTEGHYDSFRLGVRLGVRLVLELM